MTTPAPIAAGDKVTWTRRKNMGPEYVTESVQVLEVDPKNKCVLILCEDGTQGWISWVGLTRIEAAPSPLRRAVDGDFSGEER